MNLPPSRQRLVFALTLVLFFTTIFYFSHQPGSSTLNSRPNIAILCMTSHETTYDHISISNKHQYAQNHGYDLIWNFDPPTKVSNYAKHWDKLDMIRNTTLASLDPEREERYEWIWMLDYDTLITNPEEKIEEIIERSLIFAQAQGKSRKDIQMILTRDCEPLNAGSMFFRPSTWLLEFLEEWASGLQPGTPNRTEQDVLRDMLLDDVVGLQGRSVVVPQTWFNAYPEELGHCRDERDSRSWEEGMFLVHFPGAEFWLKEEGAVGRLMGRYFERAFGGREGGRLRKF